MDSPEKIGYRIYTSIIKPLQYKLKSIVGKKNLADTAHYRFKQSISDWGINRSSSCDCELLESEKELSFYCSDKK